MSIFVFAIMVGAVGSVIDDAGRMSSKIATADDRDLAKFSSITGVALAILCALWLRWSRIGDIDGATVLLVATMTSASSGLTHWRWRRRKAAGS